MAAMGSVPGRRHEHAKAAVAGGAAAAEEQGHRVSLISGILFGSSQSQVMTRIAMPPAGWATASSHLARAPPCRRVSKAKLLLVNAADVEKARA